jgi:HK97 family phage prohead protease
MTVEYRLEQDNTAQAWGYASVWDRRYRVGHFHETVRRGAVRNTLANHPDIILTVEHDRTRALARTPRTLTVIGDDVGLKWDAGLDLNDSDARSAVSKLDRGVLAESSFAFRVPNGGDEWNSDYTERTIH